MRVYHLAVFCRFTKALAVILPMSFVYSVYFVYFCIYVYTLETISLPVTEDTCTLYGNEPIPIMRTG